MFLAIVASLIPSFTFASSTKSSTNLRAFPEVQGESIVNLPAGTSVNILQKSGDWCLIEAERFGNRLKGWSECLDINESSNSGSSSVETEVTKASPVYVQPLREKPRSKFSLAINPVTLLFPWIELQIGFALTPQFRLNVTPQLMTWAWGSDPFPGSVFGGTISGSVFFDDKDGTSNLEW